MEGQRVMRKEQALTYSDHIQIKQASDTKGWLPIFLERSLMNRHLCAWHHIIWLAVKKLETVIHG